LPHLDTCIVYLLKEIQRSMYIMPSVQEHDRDTGTGRHFPPNPSPILRHSPRDLFPKISGSLPFAQTASHAFTLTRVEDNNSSANLSLSMGLLK
jgi:hypothetical protein